MLPGLKSRLHSDEGFTLVELLVVVIILAILISIAIPSYLSFRGRASDTAARADIRAAVMLVEAWHGDHDDGYTGVTLAKLVADYDREVKHVSIYGGTASQYCISSTISTTVWYKAGPGAEISAAPTGVC